MYRHFVWIDPLEWYNRLAIRFFITTCCLPSGLDLGLRSSLGLGRSGSNSTTIFRGFSLLGHLHIIIGILA
jgi:hypothetical protein